MVSHSAPTLPESDAKTIRLLEWLVQEGDEFHPGTRLAILESPGGRFTVLANGEGFLRRKLIPVGAEVAPGAPIATADADGENIPYRKPYSLAQPGDH